MREFLPSLTPAPQNFGGGSASNGVARGRGDGDGDDDGDGDRVDQERSQELGGEEERRVAGPSETVDDGEELDDAITLDGDDSGVGATEAEAEAAEGEEARSKQPKQHQPGSSLDVNVDAEKEKSTAAPAETAAGRRAWQERGAADGLPFRYVVTDVAQVGGLTVICGLRIVPICLFSECFRFGFIGLQGLRCFSLRA